MGNSSSETKRGKEPDNVKGNIDLTILFNLDDALYESEQMFYEQVLLRDGGITALLLASMRTGNFPTASGTD